MDCLTQIKWFELSQMQAYRARKKVFLIPWLGVVDSVLLLPLGLWPNPRPYPQWVSLVASWTNGDSGEDLGVLEDKQLSVMPWFKRFMYSLDVYLEVKEKAILPQKIASVRSLLDSCMLFWQPHFKADTEETQWCKEEPHKVWGMGKKKEGACCTTEYIVYHCVSQPECYKIPLRHR